MRAALQGHAQAQEPLLNGYMDMDTDMDMASTWTCDGTHTCHVVLVHVSTCTCTMVHDTTMVHDVCSVTW